MAIVTLSTPRAPVKWSVRNITGDATAPVKAVLWANANDVAKVWSSDTDQTGMTEVISDSEGVLRFWANGWLYQRVEFFKQTGGVWETTPFYTEYSVSVPVPGNVAGTRLVRRSGTFSMNTEYPVGPKGSLIYLWVNIGLTSYAQVGTRYSAAYQVIGKRYVGGYIVAQDPVGKFQTDLIKFYDRDSNLIWMPAYNGYYYMPVVVPIQQYDGSTGYTHFYVWDQTNPSYIFDWTVLQVFDFV